MTGSWTALGAPLDAAGPGREDPRMGILYTLFVGLPLSVMLFAFGLMLCLTVIGLPFGLALMALAAKVIALSPRPVTTAYYVVRR
jgi:uncharacterized membrane protein YccF (DUF307 family)